MSDKDPSDPNVPNKEEVSFADKHARRLSYLVVILIEVKRGLTPSPSSTLGKLLAAIWVGWPRLSSLDPMGMLTHPRQVSRGLRHCRDVEKLCEREVPMKVGELTEPMVDIISKVMVDCLNPGGNIDKESRLV